ncbi:hydrogenase maturation protease [Mycobacterium aquaticum]|uniref:Peptidase M52 n=1 Tax=Mycobacterium aquaticum TaxID=1927124 RepID=A0A1X0ACH6_9MYCO|nr:hydrogenase maturation protease [Mycobacterium aquaticum]ORA27761.1 peptidase M52 [Mycobacterium aquaticum]
MTSGVLIAGIGNIFLGDDGFGPEVIKHVPRRGEDTRIRMRDYGIGGMHLAYDLLDDWDALILVDALPCRGSPGTLHVFEADVAGLSGPAGLDAHAMDPAAVFASLAALGGEPPYTVVIGCEVESVADGIGLSGSVTAAIPGAVAAVEAATARLANREV